MEEEHKNLNENEEKIDDNQNEEKNYNEKEQFNHLENYYFENFIVLGHRKIDSAHKKTIKKAKDIKNLHELINAYKHFDDLMLNSQLILDLHKDEMNDLNGDAEIEKHIEHDINLNDQWRITKLSTSFGDKGGTFRIKRNDRHEYFICILWDLSDQLDREFNAYINRYQRCARLKDSEDSNQNFLQNNEQRINLIKQILENCSFSLCGLGWNVVRKLKDDPLLLEEHNNNNNNNTIQYYEKTLTTIRHFTRGFVLLPSGSIKNLKPDEEEMVNGEKMVLLLLTNQKLVPVVVNKCISTKINASKKLEREKLFSIISNKIKNVNHFLDVELFSSSKCEQIDMCYSLWIHSGKESYIGLSSVGVTKFRGSHYLIDNNQNIWNNDSLIDSYNEKIIATVNNVNENDGTKFQLNFDVMFNPVENETDYLEFWLHAFEENIIPVLFIIAWVAWGLSFNAEDNSLIEFITNNNGIRIQQSNNISFTNPLLFIWGLAGSGKTTIAVLIITILYGIAKNIVVFNQQYTEAAVAKLCYPLGSLTVLHDDVLQKAFRGSYSLGSFIMCIASRLRSRISSETVKRGVRNASILTGESDPFKSNKLDVQTDPRGVFDRIFGIKWKKILHSLKYFEEVKGFLVNLIANKQLFWTKCSWKEFKPIVTYIDKEIQQCFTPKEYKEFIKPSRSYN